MTIYRLVRSEYKDDISGYGAFLYGGRWNSKGQHALYCAAHISLAVLEIVVNYNRGTIPLLPSFHLVEIEIPETVINEIDIAILKKNWRSDIEYTRFIGDQFLQSLSGLLLKVPSVIIPEENNYLINPLHAEFKKVKIIKKQLYGLDTRLF